MEATIEHLEEVLKSDCLKRDKLLEKIKREEARIKAMKNANLLHQLGEISNKGMDVEKALAAMREGDIDTLIGLMPESQAPAKGGDE